MQRVDSMNNTSLIDKPNHFESPINAVPKEDKSRTATKNEKPKPFVKWVGGKRGIISKIINRLPNSFNQYFEPFVGGGALLFEMQPKKGFISDMNRELISAYQAIKNNPNEIMQELDKHKKLHSEDYYYKMREKNEHKTSSERVGRFIYLNKTCFNGIYRVNKYGKFNTPSGKYPANKVALYNQENIERVHKVLQNITIKVQSFEHIKPQKGDFVYFDPPYHKKFTQYTDRDFRYEDQVELAEFTHHLTNKGVKVMVSNSDTELIRELYKDFNIKLIGAPRSVNCKADGRKGKELLITNY